VRSGFAIGRRHSLVVFNLRVREELSDWDIGHHAPPVSRDTSKSGPKIYIFYIDFHSSDDKVFTILSRAILWTAH
jgi:hypothetical protein